MPEELVKREIVLDYYDQTRDQRSEKEKFVSLFSYGKTGGGKTRLLGTFPKPYVIDTDLGLLTVAGKDVKSFAVTSEMDVYGTILNLIQDIKHQNGPWEEGGPLSDRETIALDSISVTAVYMFTQIMEVQKKDTRAAYQTLLSQLTTLTSLFRELKLYGYHVVMTAGEVTRENNNTGIAEPVPLIPGSFRDFVAHQFDLALWHEVVVRQGIATYNTYTLAEQGHAAKERIGLPYKTESITFDIIMDTLNKKFES